MERCDFVVRNSGHGEFDGTGTSCKRDVLFASQVPPESLAVLGGVTSSPAARRGGFCTNKALHIDNTSVETIWGAPASACVLRSDLLAAATGEQLFLGDFPLHSVASRCVGPAADGCGAQHFRWPFDARRRHPCGDFDSSISRRCFAGGRIAETLRRGWGVAGFFQLQRSVGMAARRLPAVAGKAAGH
jgi:hypothetical protein